ncbi:MAG: hypothetical protein JXQ93_03790 [Flavobacteriaceae bacterium]
MRKANLAFSLLLCLFLTLSCTQNDDFYLLEQQSKELNNQLNEERSFLDVNDTKEVGPSCADAITNVNYHSSNGSLSEIITIGWSYVAPQCNSICPPPGLIEYDIEIQKGSIGTYGAFWGTIFSFSHVNSTDTADLTHQISIDDIGGESQLLRFRVKLKTCNTYSEWVSSSTKFQ